MGWADPEAEDERLLFNAQPLILEKMHEWVQDFMMEDRLTNCHLYGYAGQLYRGVTEEGYVVLVDVPDDLECAPGDDVQVRLTNVDNARSSLLTKRWWHLLPWCARPSPMWTRR